MSMVLSIIHSDKGRGFDDNRIIIQLRKLYGIEQTTTTPYNTCGNSRCERFNRTLPTHLNALVFAYNATPHTTMGYQPHHLMFSCMAQTPCGNWLGLPHYDSIESVSESSWLKNIPNYYRLQIREH